MIVVYEVKNLMNGKSYLGVSKNGLSDRKSKHLWTARNNRGYRLAAAIRKYGEENFEFSVVCECNSYKEAMATEVELIRQLRPQYNVTDGGEGVHGLKMSKETKARLAAAIKARPNPWIGRKHSDESKHKMREAKLGRPGNGLGTKRTDEFKEGCRMRATNNNSRHWKGVKRPPETGWKISWGNASKRLFKHMGALSW